MMGLAMDLLVWMRISFFLAHDFPESALYILIVLDDFVLMYFICLANVSLGSRMRSNIFGKGLVARM